MVAQHMPSPPREQVAAAGLGPTVGLGVALAGLGSALYLSVAACRAVLLPPDCPTFAAAECALELQLGRDLAWRQLLAALALALLSLPLGYWAYRRGARKKALPDSSP